MEIDKIIAQMTLEDKIALCEGANFWETRTFKKYGIPAMCVCDGPNGLRKQDLSGGTDMLGVNNSQPATCFPAARPVYCTIWLPSEWLPVFGGYWVVSAVSEKAVGFRRCRRLRRC